MQIVTRGERPDLHAEAAETFRERWPEFIFHDPVSKKYLARVEQHFGRFDVMALDDDGRVMAGGWGVPLAWDGTVEDLPTGYDDAMVRAVEGHEAGVVATTLSFMAAAVGSAFDRRGLATAVLQELSQRAYAEGLSQVIAPLRPTWKHRYPDVPMAEYAQWARPDGLSIDPWIRTHQRMGAEILAPARESMVITGTVGEWERWTAMVFPVTRDYVVPDALNLVHVDVEQDRAVYVEENLWVRHAPPAVR